MATPPGLRSSARIDQMLTVLLLAILIGGCFLVLRPFLSALLWAVVLCVTTWPLYWQLRSLFLGRDNFAAGLMALLIAAVFLAPFVIVGFTLADNSVRMAEFARMFIQQ